MPTREEIQEEIYNIIKDNCQSASGWVGNKAYTMELIMEYLNNNNIGMKGQEHPRYPGWFRFEPLVEEVNHGN